MQYAIDDNLLTRIKALAASDPNNADLIDSLISAEANPLISSLIWTKADVIAASRNRIHGDIPGNPDGSRFRCAEPFVEPVHEQLAQELAGDPDEFVLGIRNEVDNAIEERVIEIVRDAVEAELGKMGADHQGYDGVPGDYEILQQFARLSEEVLAGGLNACAREIAVRALRGLVI
jgi:hypothetical protein